jgi:hypothetical protein
MENFFFLGLEKAEERWEREEGWVVLQLTRPD